MKESVVHSSSGGRKLIVCIERSVQDLAGVREQVQWSIVELPVNFVRKAILSILYRRHYL